MTKTMWLGWKTTWCLEIIWSYPLSYFQSTCMNSSRIIISKEFLKILFDDLPSRFSKHWNTSKTTTWSTAISSQRISCWSRPTNLASNWSTMVAAASWANVSIPTSSQGFTERQRSSLEYHIQQPLTCGASVRSSRSCTQASHCSQARARMSS